MTTRNTLHGIALLSALGLALGAGAAAAGTVVVSDGDQDGWAAQHANCGGGASTGSQSFVDGPGTPPAGAGSREFTIGADGNSFETYRNRDYHGTRLDDLTAFSYWTYVQQDGAGGQAPYINLLVDVNGDGVFTGGVDDQLFFEPFYQTGAYPGDPVPNQGPLVVGQWQDWDALAGGWWSLNAGTFGPPLVTLASYAAAHPGAAIVNATSGAGGVRIATGCGAGAWDDFVGNVDAFTIGVDGEDTTYDFENVLDVGIDLRPGSTNQSVNTRSRQLVPIAILGSADFDPTAEVDIDSVHAEGAPALSTKFDTDDVNDDGFDDLTVYFRARDMDPPTPAECADPDAQITVTGFLTSGQPFQGQDDVDWTGPDCN